MATLFTKKFWEDAAERALKTAAQSIGLALAGSAVNILTLDWETVGGAALTGAALSVVTSIASAGIGDSGTASLVQFLPSAKTK